MQLREAPDEARATPTSPPDTQAIERLRAELDSYHEEMAQFAQMDLSEIFMRLAAMSARASGVRGQIMRVQSRRMDAFRTRELDPFIEECDRQFRLWSRLQSVRQMEADLSRGGV